MKHCLCGAAPIGLSKKIFMFPNGCTGKATKKMLLKHNLK